MIGKKRKPGWDNEGKARYRRPTRASASPKRPPDGPVVSWNISNIECPKCSQWLYISKEGLKCMECGYRSD